MKVIVTSAAVYLVISTAVARAERPEAPLQTEQSAPLSELSISISHPLESARAAVDEVLPVLDEVSGYDVHINGGADNVEQGVSIGYRVERTPLSVYLLPNGFRFGTEIRYGVHGRARKNFFLVKPLFYGSCGEGEPMRRLRAAVDVVPSIAYWTFRPNLTLSDFTPVDRCEVTFLKKDVTDRVVGPLRGRIESGLQKAAELVSERVDLRRRFESIWTAVQAPIAVPADGVWVRVVPEEAGVLPLQVDGGLLRTGLALKAHIEVYFEEPSTIEATPLPAQSANVTSEGPSTLNVHATMTIAELNRRVAAALARKPVEYRVSEGTPPLATVTSVEFSIAGQSVVARLVLSGALAGVAEISSVPSIDESGTRIAISNLMIQVERGFALRALASLPETKRRLVEAARSALEVASSYAIRQAALKHEASGVSIQVSPIGPTSLSGLRLDNTALSIVMTTHAYVAVELSPPS